MLTRMNVTSTFNYEQFTKLKKMMSNIFPGSWEEGRMYEVYESYEIKNKKVVGKLYTVVIFPDAVNSYYAGQIEKRRDEIETMCKALRES